MANITNFTQALEPLGNLVGNMVNVFSVLVGGVFGIYVLMLILRIYEIKYIRKRFDILEKEIKSLKRKKK